MSFPRYRAFLFAAVWLVSLVIGFIAMAKYTYSSSYLKVASLQFPADSHLRNSEQKSSMILFLHPRCPCSRASVGELERLMPFIQGKVDVVAVFIKPQGVDEEWVKQSLWQQTQSIPGIRVFVDENYQETDTFKAGVSGETFFYAPSGNLVFHGGITPGRGHMGDSLGREFILSWVKGEVLHEHGQKTAVFGCALKEGKWN